STHKSNQPGTLEAYRQFRTELLQVQQFVNDNKADDLLLPTDFKDAADALLKNSS
ncbi:MAG: hypothetical protein IID15_09200, partial [Candidatus Marinimicrobia bacterium]|nr:hypothetical protein [Candidatus Neomarinimicrobiota bacterium]